MKYLIFLIIFSAVFILIPFPKKFDILKQLVAAATVAATLALVAASILPPLLVEQPTSPIMITALDQKNEAAEATEIWITGVVVDGEKYAPKEVFEGTWIEKDGNLGWRSYDQPKGLTNELQGELPYGSDRKVLFEASKWRGKVDVNDNGTQTGFDCYIAEDESMEFAISVKAMIDKNKFLVNKVKWFVFGIVFCICLVVMVVLISLDSKKKTASLMLPIQKGKERELWADMLRIVSIFAIVAIHSTGWMYGSYQETADWYNGLFINAITRFAVPCFMMLSSAFILSKEQTIKSVLTQRIPRVLTPLLFWSFWYIILRKFFLREDISVLQKMMEIPLKHQNAHLWFVYQLIGFYLLAPILHLLYQKLTARHRLYLVTVTLLVPSFVDMIYRLALPDAPVFLSINWSHIGVAEIGLFLFGKLLLDYLRNHKIAWKWALVAFFVGCSGIILCNYIISVKTGKTYWDFFDQIRFPTLLFAVGMFSLFYTTEPVFQKFTPLIKSIIRNMAALTMGVYFVHCIPIAIYGGVICGSALIGVVFNFGISFMFCYVISQLPFFRRLVE